MVAQPAIRPLPPTPAARTRKSGFAGKLGDIALPVILQFIALGRKTGRLTLARREGYGRMLFRGGRLIFAASAEPRSTLGMLLVENGLLGADELQAALEQQHRSLDDVPLSVILTDGGLVDARRVTALAEERLGAVLAELLGWDGSFFRFEVLEEPESLVDVDGRDFLVTHGLAVDSALVLAAQAGAAPPEPSAVPSPTAEVTDTLIQFASSVVRRGVLLRVDPDALVAIARFDGEGRRPSPGGLQLSREQASVCTEVVETAETYRGPLDSAPGTEALLRELGGERPSEALVVPLAVAGRVRLVFYGDNGPAGNPLGAIEPLLMVLAEAAREMGTATG